MNIQANINLIQSDYSNYSAKISRLKTSSLYFPRKVSIETQVKCNSKCIFCPYPNSPRKGQVLPDELFLKIIDDLTGIPTNHKFLITLHRINEPLLDSRIQGFSRVVAEKLPHATQHFWSNGTSLSKGNFEWLAQYRQSRLTVSLNSVNEDEHVRLMGFGTEKVFQGLDYLHGLVEKGEFSLPVTLCAPYFNEEKSIEFQTACRKRWPRFKPVVRPFFEWMGESGAGRENRDSLGLPGQPIVEKVGTLPCGEWFDLHILANGYVTKCCIDESGYDGDAKYNASKRNVLEIYREGLINRCNLPARKDVYACAGCLHLG